MPGDSAALASNFQNIQRDEPEKRQCRLCTRLTLAQSVRFLGVHRRSSLSMLIQGYRTGARRKCEVKQRKILRHTHAWYPDAKYYGGFGDGDTQVYTGNDDCACCEVHEYRELSVSRVDSETHKLIL